MFSILLLLLSSLTPRLRSSSGAFNNKYSVHLKNYQVFEKIFFNSAKIPFSTVLSNTGKLTFVKNFSKGIFIYKRIFHMKNWEKLASIIIIALLALIAGFTWGATNQYRKCLEKEPQVIYVPKETVIYDTLTDIRYKDRWHVRHDTAYLQTVDTLICTDTVQVLIPIERLTFDTLTADSVHIKGSISGYNPSLDTLTVEVKKTENNIILQEKEKGWHWGFGFAIGFGYVR